MAEQNYLYTVTGLREPFYAVVDHESGRAWTAPTKDGAIRQARDAGIDNFIERSITRETFLRSLGIEPDMPQRPNREQRDRKEPLPEKKKSAALPGTWFVPGADAVDDDSHGKMSSIPARLRSTKSKPATSGSPFAARPISAPLDDASPDSDDFLIIPSDHNTAPAKSPFTDTPAPLPTETDP